MPDYTSRLGLAKPLSGEILDDGRAQLNNNFDTLDRTPGIQIVTSSTRPNQPYEGQVIYETNTDSHWTWIGNRWSKIADTRYRTWSPRIIETGVSAGTGGFAPLVQEIGPYTFLMTGRISWNSGLPTTTDRWLAWPAEVSPTGSDFVTILGATNAGGGVPFRLNGTYFDPSSRAERLCLIAQVPQAHVQNIHLMGVYRVDRDS